MKIYVLDTNVLLHDPQAIFKFMENTVVVPLTVVEEIDHFKKEQSETGRNARQVSRLIDGFRAGANLVEGVLLETGGLFQVAIYREDAMQLLPPELRGEKADNRILAVAKELEKTAEHPVIFITKDINLRIKADTIGLNAEDYESDKVSIEDLYSGTAEFLISGAQVDLFYEQGYLELAEEFTANQGVTLIDEGNPSHSAIGRGFPGMGSGASIRAIASSSSHWICCSMTISSWSRWSARPAPGKPCWPSPPVC
jgi:PhoH-like ATPase